MWSALRLRSYRNAETIRQGQERIRVRVEAIVRRLGQRSLVNMEPGYQRMAEELPKAATWMENAVGNLTELDARQALQQARQALAHLQRADAAFKEVHGPGLTRCRRRPAAK